MRRARAVALLAVTAVVVVLALASGPRADARVPPLLPTTTTAPPDDSPPEGDPVAVTPVFEVLGPVVWPACQDAIAVALAFPEIPSVTTEDGPLFVLCNVVTEPDGRQSCSVDATSQQAIAQAAAPVLGATPVPVPDQEPVAGAVGLLVELRDAAPPPPTPLPADLVGVAAATFGCVPADQELPLLPPLPSGPDVPQRPTSPGTAAGGATSGGSAAPSLSLRLPAGTQVAVGPAAPALSPGAAATPIGATTSGTSLLLRGPKFAYPVVFAVPLLLLVAGAYLGRTFSRPIAVRLPLRSEEHPAP